VGYATATDTCSQHTPGKSQGRPRTTPSSQLISQNGLPIRVSHQQAPVPEHRSSRTRADTVSSPDNGSAYIAHDYAQALSRLGLKHLRIKPGRPRTNGKAERLIQTLLNEWAYARIYGSSAERTAALPIYLDRYNYRRPHGSLKHQPPASRLNNVVGNYT
jgi:transposase InsO family protein